MDMCVLLNERCCLDRYTMGCSVCDTNNPIMHDVAVVLACILTEVNCYQKY